MGKDENKKIDYKELLLNSYISLSNSTSSLKDIAYAKLTFLVFFLEDEPINFKTLKTKISKELNSISIPDDSLENALKLLQSRRLINKKEESWVLIDSEKEKTKKQLEYSTNTSNNICKKYFPKSIKEETIIKWFNDVNEKYFSTFADKLIELYSNKKSLILDINKIINPITSKYKLQQHSKELEQGYREFLLSNDREEEEKIWNLMQSLLSSKIICADLSPDFLNIDKYRNAKILLDTNILFANSFDINRGLEDTVKSFGKITSTIGASLYIAQETINEYKAVCERKKEEMLKIWDTYSIEILEKSDRNDGFFKSLIELGCKTKEDIDRFFEAVCELPKDIGGAKINILNKKTSEQFAYNKSKDVKLFEEIQNKWSELHEGAKKSENVVIHDLVLTKICRKLNESERIFVLTLDMSLESLSLSWINEKEDPIWRSLFSLVQVLAINGGGPDFDIKDMAPLVKIFIEQEDLGRSDSFDKRDLLSLTDISDRINELSDTKILALLNKIHLANMQKNSNEQAIKDIQMELERSLVKRGHELNETISEKDEQLKELKDKLGIEKRENARNKKQKQWLWLTFKSVLKVALSFFLFVYLGDQIKEYYELNSKYEIVQIILFIGSPIYSIVKDLQNTKEIIKKL